MITAFFSVKASDISVLLLDNSIKNFINFIKWPVKNIIYSFAIIYILYEEIIKKGWQPFKQACVIKTEMKNETVGKWA